jgi:hypothetical protein
MKKIIILKHFGGVVAEFTARLGYSHRNIYYNWPDVLTDRIYADLLTRMKSKRIPIPKEWKKV